MKQISQLFRNTVTKIWEDYRRCPKIEYRKGSILNLFQTVANFGILALGGGYNKMADTRCIANHKMTARRSETKHKISGSDVRIALTVTLSISSRSLHIHGTYLQTVIEKPCVLVAAPADAIFKKSAQPTDFQWSVKSPTWQKPHTALSTF